MRRLFLGLAALLAASSVGCSSKEGKATGGAEDAGADAPGRDAETGYPLDGKLRLNQVQLKATHNSYHIETPGTPIPQWQYSRDPLDVQLDDQGVRGVELDTHFDEATGGIDVFHIPSLDEMTTCRKFVDCLGILKTWSDAHPGHETLFVQIEPKEPSLNQTVDFAAYSDALDDAILSVWPRDRLVTPADVQGDAATLREAVTGKGWPTLGEGRQKALFYANDRTTFHDAYTRGGSNIDGRVLFPESKPEEPIGAIVILNTPAPDTADVVRQGFIVRTMCDGVPPAEDLEGPRETALTSGAHVISTDFPVTTAVDGGGSVAGFEIPGGTPSRCNPVTAPEGCEPEDIENPALLAGGR